MVTILNRNLKEGKQIGFELFFFDFYNDYVFLYFLQIVNIIVVLSFKGFLKVFMNYFEQLFP